MKFICTEFTTDTKNLYKEESISQNIISENNNLYTKTNKLDTADGVKYNYLTDTVRKLLFSSFIYNTTSLAPGAWLTAKGLAGTDHTGISNTFDWSNLSCADIKSSYFFTILAEDGVHFALPQRISTSRQIQSFTVISEFNNLETSFSFQGETGYKFTIGENPSDTVKAISIDSTIKSIRINKYKSLQNVITIQSGDNADPLDYVLYKDGNYILISKTEIKNNLYVYTCVKEVKDVNTIAGATITPNIPLASIAYVDSVAGSATLPILYNRLESSIFAAQSVIGNNFFAVGTPLYGAGYFGNAYNIIDGAGYSLNYLYCANPIAGLTKGTIELWYRFSNASPSNYDAMMDMSSGTRLYLYRYSTSETADFGFFGTNYNTTSLFTNDSNWHHFAFQWHSTGGISGGYTGQILIDNVPKWTTANAFTNNTSTSANWLLGGLQVVGNTSRIQHPFDGFIDEIKVYSVVKTDFSKRFREGYY